MSWKARRRRRRLDATTMFIRGDVGNGNAGSILQPVSVIAARLGGPEASRGPERGERPSDRGRVIPRRRRRAVLEEARVRAPSVFGANGGCGGACQLAVRVRETRKAVGTRHPRHARRWTARCRVRFGRVEFVDAPGMTRVVVAVVGGVHRAAR
jgi:hypothetical protein